jgi:hypothetical protein
MLSIPIQCDTALLPCDGIMPMALLTTYMSHL